MKKPVAAIIYDFDNTLSTKDQQEFLFIPALGMTAEEFWQMCDETCHKYKMDHILAYMYLMVKLSKERNVEISYEQLRQMGSGVKFFKGVKSWFSRINAYGESLDLEVRHYIVSCGLKPMIEGCDIAREFYNVFACDFMYDENGKPVWPAVAINYTSKTQFLYRINKGVEDVDENKKLNMYMPKDIRAVPFENMVYVGDGLTDVPSMKLTRQRGGYAIGVYRKPEDADYLVDEERVDFYVKSDFSENSQMDLAMKAILNKISAVSKISELSQKSIGKD